MSYELNINAKQAVEDNKRDFDLIPNGKYAMIIDNYEEKIGKTSGTPYLNLTFTIVEGEFKSRKIYKMFFINGSEQAKKIAFSDLGKIALAVGVEQLKNVDQLLNKPFYGVVGKEDGTGGYADKNVWQNAEPYKKSGDIGKTIETKKPAPAKEVFEDDIPF